MAILSSLLLSSSALLVLAQCTGLSPSWTSEPAGILPIWRSVVLRAAAFSSADLRGGVLAAACDAPAAEGEAADGPAEEPAAWWKKSSNVPRSPGMGSSDR